jgi:tetratricopeptide (TPR) repeat protein
MITGLATAARAARAMGDTLAEASTLNDLGELHLSLGNHATAAALLARALELAAAQEFIFGVLTVNINLARLYRLTDRPAAAIALYEKCISDAQNIGERVREGKAEHYLGDTLADLDQHERALPHYHVALHLRSVLNDAAGQVATHTALAGLHTSQSRLEQAHRHCRQALAQLDGAGDLTASMKLRTVEARLAKAEGNDRDALRLSQEAVALAERAHNATGQARALEAFGEILHARGNLPDAISAWNRAAGFYRGRGRHAKAERIEALVAALSVVPSIPEARAGDEATVAMPSPPRRRSAGHHGVNPTAP